ncbi:hypothetical protein HDV03_000356 [Kappamyces sp. JEL0829]|nr:hypothetical protein HDV03_000356 [Kappamyces sp. JEL0829]
MTRNREMHHHFHDRIPERDLCMATYTCSLKSSSGLSVPGKLYLTARHLLFHSYLGDTKQVQTIAAIESIRPTRDILFPSCLEITFRTEIAARGRRPTKITSVWALKHLLNRDKAHRNIKTILLAHQEFGLDASRSDAAQSDSRDPVPLPRSLQKKLSLLIEQSDPAPHQPLPVATYFLPALIIILFNLYLLWKAIFLF